MYMYAAVIREYLSVYHEISSTAPSLAAIYFPIYAAHMKQNINQKEANATTNFIKCSFRHLSREFSTHFDA